MTQSKRRCLECEFEGEMKTWLGNYNAPQAIGCLLMLFYVIPGIIFLAWGWGKYKCPQCGALGKNISLLGTSKAEASQPLQPNRLELLERLARLKEKGALTTEEFEAEKRRIMG